MLNPISFQQFCYFTLKLYSIVCHYVMRDTISAKDVLLDESGHLLCPNVLIGLCFYPSGEVIYRHHYESMPIRGCRMYLSDNVYSQAGKGQELAVGCSSIAGR